MKKIILVALLSVCAFGMKAQQKFEIPVYNNTYVNQDMDYLFENNIRPDIDLGKKGAHFYKVSETTASSYYYVEEGQTPTISFIAKGKGKIEIKGDGFTKVVKVKSNEAKEYKVATVKQNESGYIKLTYRMLAGSDKVLISKFVFEGVSDCPIYLKPEYSNHFGLRGPSCHLNYSGNRFDGPVDWAKIDITVPEELDKTGSYYMALGFDGGYFGFQNNNKNTRQVLFSVWNTQDADNPDDVKPENQTQVVRKGEGVTAKNFGHEGSGKQSFRTIDWKPGQTYTFVLHAEKYDESHVDFSAWFYDRPNDKWYFMSTLRRPKTNTLIGGLHSFLENFNPFQGDKTRRAYYHNGWAKSVNGDWMPLLRARMTNDETARSGVRVDFNGGVEDGKFYLTNGGYFNRAREVNRMFKVDGSANTKPDFDLNMLKNYLK